MGRSSFVGIASAMAREAARERRRAEADQRRALRAQEQAERSRRREFATAAKEARQRHIEEQGARAEDLTAAVNEKIDELRGVLDATLHVDDTISFDSLRRIDAYPAFAPDPKLTGAASPPREQSFLERVTPPAFLARLLVPGTKARYQQRLDAAREEWRRVLAAHERQESERISALAGARREYESAKARHDLEVARRNAEVEELTAAYGAADPQAIVGYVTMVLERSDYPEGFPQDFRVAYSPESKEIVLDYDLPTPTVIPTVASFRYVKTKDVIEEKGQRESEIKELYQDVVASVALRTCHEVFESDQGGHVSVVTFNGFVHTVDPATGRDIHPCLISVRSTKERFDELDLGRVDKKACLRNLGAQVSPRPYEVQPVKPIVEFDMVDKRYVEQSDVLGDLESRPNLMDLTPSEFEHLVGNLFGKLGLETKLTRASRDGGVDVVAYDVRPVIGGKVVIQAKRYRNTVGVAAVRDLFGTMMNEGANKGILVATSGYGPDAFEFAKDKPIELLDGGRLLYLLDQIGVRARIVFPEEATGPAASTH